MTRQRLASSSVPVLLVLPLAACGEGRAEPADSQEADASPDLDASLGEPPFDGSPIESDAGPTSCAAGEVTLAEWSRITPCAAPPARSGHALAYDSARGRVVLFAGKRDGEPRALADTWEWDGELWHDVTPSGDSPVGRFHHAMAYDADRGRVVLFGGHDDFVSPGGRRGDTWEWDGERWRDVTPATRSPEPRLAHAMVYDSARRRVVLFGGFGGTGFGNDFNDTWEWNGERWRRMDPPRAPVRRAFHAMAYDEERGVTVLFGGNGRDGWMQDTWEWDGASWSPRETDPTPPLRSSHAMAYDRASGRTILHGGQSDSTEDFSLRSDTWEWDGESWTETTGPGSPARGYHALAYDPARDLTLLFAGEEPHNHFHGDVWIRRPPP